MNGQRIQYGAGGRIYWTLRNTVGFVTGATTQARLYVSKDDGAPALLDALQEANASELSATNAPGIYYADLTGPETQANKLIFSGPGDTDTNQWIEAFVVYTQPPDVNTLTIATGAKQAISDVVMPAVIDGLMAEPIGDAALTEFAELLRLLAAMHSGKTSGLPNGFVVRDRADTKNVLTATLDASGDRVVVTDDLA